MSNRPNGRPTEFTHLTAERIIDALVDGKSLRTICGDPDMPGITTVIRWLADERFAEFRAQYAIARLAQADTLADEIIHIADNPQIGTTITTEGEGADATTKEVKGDMVAHRRLQIDARKWYSGKLAPKKYGDKTIIGGDPENPLYPKSEVPTSIEEAMAWYQDQIASGGNRTT